MKLYCLTTFSTEKENNSMAHLFNKGQTYELEDNELVSLLLDFGVAIEIE